MAEPTTRRRFLGRAGSLALASSLAGCGIEGTLERAGRRATPVPQITHKKVPIGNWTFSNWPLYIDKSVLRTFERQYGGDVKYVEDINDNDEFYGKVRQQLQADRPIGRDIVTLTDFMAVKWVRNRYVEPLDKKNMPNVVANLVDNLRSVPYDKKRDFTVPWQSGAVGLGYNPKKTGRELNSIKDLFDPAFKGRVTMLSEPYDSASTVLLGDGIDPTTAKIDQILAAIEKIGQASEAGQFRRFTGNDYSTDLTKGNIWVALAYSGDLVQLQSDNPDLKFVFPDEGAMAFTDNMMIPAKAENIYAAETMMNFVYEPEIAAKLAIYVNYLSPVKGIREIVEKEDPDVANNPLIFPPDEIRAKLHPYPALSDADERRMKQAMAEVTGGMSLNTRRRLLPWLFLGPGLLWLLIFFLYPLLNQGAVSLMTGNPEQGYELTWAFENYTNAISEYKEQFGRSILYAGIATVLCLVIGFPLAYFTAFHAGRWKGLILLLIILPFFMSYVLRTVAWQLILSDDGRVVGLFRDLGIIAEDGRLLASSTAVIAGITYNFLPFMALPLYVALEKIDPRLLEAATDLYASRATAFRKVTLPLALPGIFAGSLLTFIPACGDFINAALLGTPRQFMIGNVIQSKFLNILDYPTAAALSFTLMLFILVGIFLYARLLGARNLTEAAI